MMVFICDDEQQELALIQTCLERAAAELSADIEVTVFHSGETLLKAVEEGARPALAILDIYMEGLNGMEVGQKLRALMPDLLLAFLTTSRDHAVDAFELEALHYMVKPVTADKSCALLERFLVRVEEPVRMLELTVWRGEQIRFPLSKIERIISKSRGVEVYVRGQSSLWLPCLFREVEAQLVDAPEFLRLSRGCMVNLYSVRSIDYDMCYLKSGESLLISRREHTKVQSRYSDFLFSQMNERKRMEI